MPSSPGCLDKVDIPQDQLNTVIHEVMRMVLNLPVTEEGKICEFSHRSRKTATY